MLIIEVQDYYCALEKFVINGIEADYNDFGTKIDTQKHLAEEYGCGNMEFIPDEPTQEVLDKYSINVTDYEEICNRLIKELSYHKCSLCV